MEPFTWSIPNSIVKWTSWCGKSVPRMPSQAPIFWERRILNCWILFHFFNGKVGPFASTEECLNISVIRYTYFGCPHLNSILLKNVECIQHCTKHLKSNGTIYLVNPEFDCLNEHRGVWNQCPVCLLMLQYFVSVEFWTVGFRFTFLMAR